MKETFQVFPPRQSPYQTAVIQQALGLAVVAWPSGRRTLEQYAANVVTSELERAMARDSEQLVRAKRRNLEETMRDFQRRSAVSGYFIRTKKRRKARKVDSVTWVHPNEYDGPVPDGRGVLPC